MQRLIFFISQFRHKNPRFWLILSPSGKIFLFWRPDRRPAVFDFGMFSSLCTGLGGSMLFCGGSSSRLSSVARGLSDAARCLFLLHGLCMGLFGLQRGLYGPLWLVFVLLFGWLSVFLRLVASCIHAKHKKNVARSGFSPFLVLDLPFFRVFGVDFRPIVVPWALLRPGLQRFNFAPFRGSAAPLVVLTGWALVS